LLSKGWGSNEWWVYWWIHLSDNVEETELLKTVLDKNKKFVIKGYVRKGEKANINKLNENNESSYIRIVKSINSQEER